MTTVKEIMTTDVKVCQPHDAIVEAAKIMRDVNVGIVPVCEGKKVIGMITDRDIVIQAIADGKDGNSVHCHEVMTTDVTTCTPDMDIHECANIMSEQQIRRLPVVENGELVGICAIGDLARVNIHIDEAGQALSNISDPLH
ncbi:CBS domain-containing protein [Niallia taxi]|uniref:CBS domain-containing protein n=1 Tax=Niallia taxi TaxID=2499688 RepID=UPI00300821F9